MKYFAFSSHDKVIFSERTATLFAFGAKKSEKKKNIKFDMKSSEFVNIFLNPFDEGFFLGIFRT